MKANFPLRLALPLLLCFPLASVGRAEVKLHSLFTEDMVLQREKPVPVWGAASVGEKVTVSIGGQKKETRADAAGNWNVVLDPMQVATGQVLKVIGQNEITLGNVALGDVYLCSGQSNMAYGVDHFNNPGEESANANYADIRLFTVPQKSNRKPQRELGSPAKWKVCSPAEALHFSATAYYFGRELHKQLNVPIGLIAAAWGGTPIQAWVSRDTLLQREDMRETTLQTEADLEELAKGSMAERMQRWWQNSDVGLRSKWHEATLDDSRWKSAAMPTPWQKTEVGEFFGTVWFRKQVEIPAAWAGKDLVLRLGRIGDRDATYFNGQLVGDMGLFVWYLDRSYKIPAASVKGGKATIAVGAVYIGTGYGAGLLGPEAPAEMRLELAEDPTQKISLNGEWKYQQGVAQKEGTPVPRWVVDYSRDAGSPTILFNGLISPLVPFSLRGMVWYQGESDVDNPARYRKLFPDLIRDWRQKWGSRGGGEIPFYFVQLPNFAPPKEAVANSWAELRDAQAQALKLPGVHMATTIDIGSADNIHPGDKQGVGRRLALLALAREYGHKVEYSGPQLQSIQVKGDKVSLVFSHAAGLKTTNGAAPLGFAVQGQDGKWHQAQSRLEAETGAVTVWAEGVPAPRAVRYAFENNPRVNLVNGAGLPAAPFRTDAVGGQ